MRSGLDGRPGGSRSILQALQRFGSFRNFFSWWKRCSPALKTKSTLRCVQVSTRSWNSGMAPSCNPNGRRRCRYLRPLKELVRFLFHFATTLFPVAFPCQSLLYPLFFAGLEIEGVTFHLFDDVLCLHFPLKATKSILKCFTLLEFYFSQLKNTSQPIEDCIRNSRGLRFRLTDTVAIPSNTTESRNLQINTG